jgi:hypothetical protein
VAVVIACRDFLLAERDMPVPDRPQPMGGHPTPDLPGPLRKRFANDVGAAAVAAAAVELWREVDCSLRPIIGQRGVVALFNRSGQLTALEHPWLEGVRQDPDAELQLSVIANVFSQQEARAAISGGDALLLAFHQLLGALIGMSLSERLLPPAFSPATGASPTQDSPS